MRSPPKSQRKIRKQVRRKTKSNDDLGPSSANHYTQLKSVVLRKIARLKTWVETRHLAIILTAIPATNQLKRWTLSSQMVCERTKSRLRWTCITRISSQDIQSKTKTRGKHCWISPPRQKWHMLAINWSTTKLSEKAPREESTLLKWQVQGEEQKLGMTLTTKTFSSSNLIWMWEYHIRTHRLWRKKRRWSWDRLGSRLFREWT